VHKKKGNFCCHELLRNVIMTQPQFRCGITTSCVCVCMCVCVRRLAARGTAITNASCPYASLRKTSPCGGFY